MMACHFKFMSVGPLIDHLRTSCMTLYICAIYIREELHQLRRMHGK